MMVRIPQTILQILYIYIYFFFLISKSISNPIDPNYFFPVLSSFLNRKESYGAGSIN